MNNHSVFIFTFNRSHLLKRQLNLFFILDIKSKVYILDGSTNLMEKEKNEFISKEFGLIYEHEVSYQKRFELIDKLNTSDYISYCSDDDIVDPRFYCLASNFLENNKSYSAVVGRYLCLQYNQKIKILGFRLVNHLPNDYDINTGSFITNIIALETAYRLGCPPTHYGVRRFETHKILSKNISKIKYFTSVEQLEKISILLSGGVKVLPYFFGLRDYYNTPTTHEYRDLKLGDDSDIMVLKDIIKKYLLYQNKDEYYSELATKYSYSMNLKTTTRKNYLSFRENKGKAFFDVIRQYIFNNIENIYDSGLDSRFKKAFRKVFFN